MIFLVKYWGIVKVILLQFLNLCVLCVEDFNAKDAENSQRAQRRFLEVPLRGCVAICVF